MDIDDDSHHPHDPDGSRGHAGGGRRLVGPVAVTSPDITSQLRAQLIDALPEAAGADRVAFADELLDIARRAGTRLRDARLQLPTPAP